MTNKYASQDLYSLGIKEPLSKEELYNLHGITDYPTDATHYNTWYNLTAASWLEVLTYHTLYDSSTEKYFIKDHYNSSELTSCWMTLQDQAAGAFKDENTRWARMSPTNKLSDRPLYKSDIATEVTALQFDPDDTSKPTLYYVHPNYMNAANIGWHTEDELIALGYSFNTFDEVCSPLFFKNTGDTDATVKLKMVGTVNNADYETSSDGISWQSYSVTANPATITLQPNDRVFFRGRKDVSINSNYIQFEMTGHIEAYGNINSLLSKTDYKNLLDISSYVNAFSNLFYMCSSLYRAPKLPATILSGNCYNSMFSRCVSLIDVYMLPATILDYHCYDNMFNQCTSLVKSPDILARDIDENMTAFNGMFNSCTSLNSVKCKLMTCHPGDTHAWLYGVSPTGTLYCDDLNCWSLDDVSGIPSGWEAFVEMPLCLINKGTASSSIALNNMVLHNSSSSGVALESKSYRYSMNEDYANEDSWSTYTFDGNNGETIILPPGGRIYFKGSRSHQSSLSIMNFSITGGRIYAYGNVNSMFKPDNFASDNSIDADDTYAVCRMFYLCNLLRRAPSFPATQLSEHCYEATFQNCSGLENTANLPCKSLSYAAYYSMFSRCTSIRHVLFELPATTLNQRCYQSMFSTCTSLEIPPELPATSLAIYCYAFMFSGCGSLEDAPELPATQLARYCYYDMFFECSSLVTAPELPATQLENYCYENMFIGCSSLQTAPVLHASKLKPRCYNNMFKNCVSLNEVHIHAEIVEEGVKDYSSSWLSNVAPTGKFYYYADMWTLNSSSGIPSGWSAYCEKPLCFTNVGNSDATIKLSAVGSTDLHPSYSVSRDGSVWESYTMNSDIILNDSLGNTVFFKGSHDSYHSTTISDYLNFTTSSNSSIESSGNVNSLLSPDFSDIIDLSSYGPNTYYRLFKSCTSITTAPILPATSMVNGCYYEMFSGCTSITIAPKLPAISLSPSCYNSMFENCSSLTTAPDLQATTCPYLCYHGMFYGCTNLQKMPQLPATSLDTHCYSSMFANCTSLTDITNILPAGTLSTDCYSRMFYGCTSMVKSPELPAKTLAAGCYANMFDGCTLLNEVKCYAINTSASNCTSNMLNSVASNGTFYCEAVPEYIDDGEGYTLEPLPQWYDKNVIPNSWSTVITKEHYTGFLAQDGLPTSMTANTDYQLYWLNDNSNACPLVNAYAKYQSLFADDPDAFTVESIGSSYSPSISAVDSSGNISARVGTGMSNISKVDYCIDVTNINNY